MRIDIYSKYKLLITNHSSRLSEENETIYDNIFVKDNLKKEMISRINYYLKNYKDNFEAENEKEN